MKEIEVKVKFDPITKTWPDGKFIPIGNKLNKVHLNESQSQIPTKKDLENGLNSSFVHGIEKNRKISPGTQVGLRIDIPFFNSTGKYAVTIHARKQPNSYDSMARLKGPVVFGDNKLEGKARKVLFEGREKSPFAVVNGALDQTRTSPKDIPDINDWIPVGFNPHKATFFYDKRSGKEVLAGRDAISIGNTVFTKKYGIEYGEKYIY